MAHHVTAIVLAAGTGQRVGSDIPKQFLPLGGRPMIQLSLDVFQASPAVDAIVVALPAGDTSGHPELDGFDKIAARVPGGDTRQASLKQALAHLPEGTDTVMVHDAARPLVGAGLVVDLLAALAGDCDGAIPAIPLEDTIKRVSEDRLVEQEMDRSGIWRVQTPQVFRRTALEDSVGRAIASGLEATDCSQMLTSAGYRVKVVEGDPLNFKVTRAADLWLAEQVLASREEPDR
ncbi:MAG TPA: 2-C-methyl-D-erythritol 4-phosphate cytidylyltransferase [Actinomycetota bacterium]|nr:2-C-methyl-D-erythritol 4-phosphate cytidylyltransferase [Actinomycetota bacterium]